MTRSLVLGWTMVVVVLSAVGAMMLLAGLVTRTTHYPPRQPAASEPVSPGTAELVDPATPARVVPPHVAVLTFVGGPSAQAAAEIQAVLRSSGVPATFFVTGSQSTLQPAALRSIAAAGDEIGNGGFTAADLRQTDTELAAEAGTERDPGRDRRRVTVLRQRNGGKASALTHGLRRARHDVIVPGAVGGFRREALAEVRGVPTRTLAEDTDLTMAINLSGWRVVYAGDAIAWIEAPSDIRALARQRVRWCYGTMQAMWAHRRSIRPDGGTGSGHVGSRGIP